MPGSIKVSRSLISVGFFAAFSAAPWFAHSATVDIFGWRCLQFGLESPFKWTLESVRTLADELKIMGHAIRYRTVLQNLGYSLQANSKVSAVQLVACQLLRVFLQLFLQFRIS